MLANLLLSANAFAGEGAKPSPTIDHRFDARESVAQREMGQEQGSEAVPQTVSAVPNEVARMTAAITVLDAVGAQRTSAKGLAVFTLVRGGSSEAEFESFVSSRRCLEDVMPAWIVFDHVAFHEGNVPAELQHALRQRV
jgi:hypothetical protein